MSEKYSDIIKSVISDMTIEGIADCLPTFSMDELRRMEAEIAQKA